MRYVDDSKQELLVSTTQFPALVIAHQSYDKARYHWHSGLEVLYAKDCPMSVVVNGAMTVLQPGQARVIPPEAVHAVHMVKDEDRGPRRRRCPSRSIRLRCPHSFHVFCRRSVKWTMTAATGMGEWPLPRYAMRYTTSLSAHPR